jgi:hypothetical protein
MLGNLIRVRNMGPLFDEIHTHPVDVELVLAFKRIAYFSQEGSVAWVIWGHDVGLARVALDRCLAGLDCNRGPNRLVTSFEIIS